ncbi:MAG: class I SAM-dependent RNA methyltransferase [Acidocella sp.]|uniref:class I SAM-dependent RNA methyltransferase n=1 Tax=Acidocella sp. TaxID=50710 RepID=UPI003FBC4F27
MAHCQHFGVCGGCAVADRHAIDKFALLKDALARAGYLDAPVSPLVEVPAGTRRRVDLAATRKGTEISLGLHQARGAEVVDMRECALLRPEILPLLPPLRELLRSLLAFRRAGSVVINWLDNGPDILLRLDAEFQLPDRKRIIDIAKGHGVPRISIATGTADPEPAIILQNPVIRFAGVDVTPPPGGFLQASAEGEAAIVAAMLAGLPKLTAKSRIVELFAGCGTLTFPLVQHARVEAYEGDAFASAAAEIAVRAANLAGRVSFTRRDLHRRPLQAAEMAKAAAIVLDPPYAGAAAQMRFIVQAGVGRIVYVSCNPDALANDAGALRRAGYSVLAATPIDQFPYSENVESVVVFGKGK